MKTKTIFKRKAALGLLFSAMIFAGLTGCQKGTFSVNDVNPNSPTSAPINYTLVASLVGTANYVQGGNADPLENWMGYWTQSGGYTASDTYVLYRLTSSNFTGNFDNAYQNLVNYNLLLKTAKADPNLGNYKAIGTVMQAFIYQRLVDLYNKIPYSQALSVNPTFSYKYDEDPKAIYASLITKCDSAILIIKAAKANTASISPGSSDIMFGGDMDKWAQFAKTLKLKMLIRESVVIGDAGIVSGIGAVTPADFLSTDAAMNPGYSNAADAQVSPFYFDVIGNAQANPGANTNYWRGNDYAISFFQANKDPRLLYVYAPAGSEVAKGYLTPLADVPANYAKFKGRVYGSTSGTESNTVISAIVGTGFDQATQKQKGPAQGAIMIPAHESLFLQAEAAQRGVAGLGTPQVLYEAAVKQAFKFVGVADYAAKAATYVSQNGNSKTTWAATGNKIDLIITQKWASMNSVDPLESYSDWRRLVIPASLPVSIYPGNTALHIPYRFPYPLNEQTLNSANVPAGGSGTDALTSKIFWMP